MLRRYDICSADNCSADNCSGDICSGVNCSADNCFAEICSEHAERYDICSDPPTIIAPLKYAPKIIHAPQHYLFHRHLLCRRLNRQLNSQDCVWFLMWNYERHLKRKSFMNNFAQLFCFLIESMLWSRWNWSTIDSSVTIGSFKYCIGFGIRKCCDYSPVSRNYQDKGTTLNRPRIKNKYPLTLKSPRGGGAHCAPYHTIGRHSYSFCLFTPKFGDFS